MSVYECPDDLSLAARYLWLLLSEFNATEGAPIELRELATIVKDSSALHEGLGELERFGYLALEHSSGNRYYLVSGGHPATGSRRSMGRWWK